MTQPHFYVRGDRVRYDENAGTVVHIWATGRGEGVYDYTVQWDGTHRVTRVWGSDLLPEKGME